MGPWGRGQGGLGWASAQLQEGRNELSQVLVLLQLLTSLLPLLLLPILL